MLAVLSYPCCLKSSSLPSHSQALAIGYIPMLSFFFFSFWGLLYLVHLSSRGSYAAEPVMVVFSIDLSPSLPAISSKMEIGF